MFIEEVFIAILVYLYAKKQIAETFIYSSLQILIKTSLYVNTGFRCNFYIDYNYPVTRKINHIATCWKVLIFLSIHKS